MKHLLFLLLACTFSFPSRGQSIIQLSPLQGERGIQAAIEKASMNGSSILLHDGDYILHKSIDIKNCKKGIIIKGKNPGKVQLRCDIPQQRLSIYEKGIGQFRNKRTRRYF